MMSASCRPDVFHRTFTPKEKHWERFRTVKGESDLRHPPDTPPRTWPRGKNTPWPEKQHADDGVLGTR